MFEYWTPTGHIFAIVISMMYATYVAKGKIFIYKFIKLLIILSPILSLFSG